MKRKLDGLGYGGSNMVRKIMESNNLNIQRIQLDIANWVSREPYEESLKIEKKIKQRLQKKYKLKIDSKNLEERILHYREIYKIIKDKLSEFIFPSKSGYAEPKNIKDKELKQFLLRKFPHEHEKILDVISDWVEYHEYLR